MKRLFAFLLVVTLLSIMLCGCNTQPLSLYAKDCLQRACDDPTYLGYMFCMTNPSSALAPDIGQDLVDALRLEEWVLYEEDERVFNDHAMTTIFVHATDDDQIAIKVGKEYGSIGIFEDQLLPLGTSIATTSVEKPVYYRLPQNSDGELFAVVDALAEHYINLANDGENSLLD